MAWTVRPDGVVDFLNRRWLDYAGLSLEQYVEDPMGPIHPDDIPRVMETWRAQMAIGGGYENEMRLRRADGEYRWFLVRTEPLRDAQGNVVKWYGTSTDITDRKRAEEQLRITSAQLRALSARLSSAREEEGTRIARELHDQLGSALTSLKWDLEGVSKRCSERVSQTDYAVLHDRLEEMMSLVDDILGNVRRISSELRPSILDDLGLIATIEWQARQFESRSGIICKVDVLVDNLQLSREQSTAVFRILQEALTNILRHAHATRVNILVDVDDGELILEVRDNGRGITDAQNTGSRSLGLIGMRERAHLLGGRMEITGTAGNGTLLILRVPVHVPTSN
jgi:PAS domain S-box-containing protein